MSVDIMTCLISGQAEEMDIELGTSYPDVFPLPSPQAPLAVVNSNDYLQRKDSLDRSSSYRDEDSLENTFQQPWDHLQQLPTLENSINLKGTSKIDIKNKKISKMLCKSSKRDLNVPKKKKGYPTNNFLPNFKVPHLQFLEKYLGKDTLKKNPFISELNSKNGISMQDYQRLYRTPEYTEAFEVMFKSKFLYRELLLSRCLQATRIIHQKKIYVFEQAFREKKFQRIN